MDWNGKELNKAPSNSKQHPIWVAPQGPMAGHNKNTFYIHFETDFNQTCLD